MHDTPAATDRKDLIKELVTLRKGPGLTLAKLSRSPTLLSLSGATPASPQPAHDRIVAALASMGAPGAGKKAAALRAAFGLDPEHSAPLLDDRRKSFGKAHSREKDAVKNWEDAAIDELALLLLGTPALAGLPITAPDLQHAYVLENLEIIARYDQGGRFVETIQTREVMALVDDADGFIYATHNSTRLTMIAGGTVIELDRQPSGTVRHKIIFPQPLQRGESTEFAFREEQVVTDDERPIEDRVSQFFHLPTRRYWVQAQFVGDPPPIAWTFDRMTHFERPGHPTKKNRVAAKDGKITAEFTNLLGGLASGIAWRW